MNETPPTTNKANNSPNQRRKQWKRPCHINLKANTINSGQWKQAGEGLVMAQAGQTALINGANVVKFNTPSSVITMYDMGYEITQVTSGTRGIWGVYVQPS